MKKDLLFKLLLRLVSVFFLFKGVFNLSNLLFRMGSRFSIVAILQLVIFFLPFCAKAQFPYNESFMGTSAAGVKYGGNTGAFLTAGLTLDNNIKDPENEGYLRLTSNQQYQTGYVYADAIFLGTYGLDIEFEYFTYGGTGDADGICFFLFDATANPFTIGGFGGSLGYAQYIKDDNDDAVPTGNSSNAVPDFRAGVFYTTPDWYIGISALDLFSGSSTIEDYQHSSAYSDYIVRTRHVYFIAGSLHTLPSGLKIKPSVMIREDFKGPTNADLNAMAILNDRLWFGAGYRTSLKVFKKKYQQTNLSSQAAVILIAQFYVNEAFRIGYSYDYATSKLSGYQSGTHELTIGIAFGKASRSTLCSRVF